MKMNSKGKQKYKDDFNICEKCDIELTEKKYTHIKKLLVLCMMVLTLGFSLYGCNKSDNEDNQVEKSITVSMKDDLKIENDWEADTRDGYIYIEGTVTNTSSTKTINYYEIEAKFCDCDEAPMDYSRIDDSQPLKPKESRKFEIVHKRPTFYRTIKLSIKKVN